jgi:hypothetical protein
MSVKWKIGMRWRVGIFYVHPVTRLLTHNLPTFALPVIAALLLWHWAFSALAIILGWGAFFWGSRHELRAQVRNLAAYMVRDQGIAHDEALKLAQEYLETQIIAKMQ